jgi:hypothetical protein
MKAAAWATNEVHLVETTSPNGYRALGVASNLGMSHDGKDEKGFRGSGEAVESKGRTSLASAASRSPFSLHQEQAVPSNSR